MRLERIRRPRRRRAEHDRDDEQLVYARVLSVARYVALAVLVLTFVLYVSGIVQPAVPIAKLPEYWHLGLDRYLQGINADFVHRSHPLTGWWWLTELHRADYLTYVGIAWVCAVTIICYIGIMPTLLRKRDLIYLAIAVAEVLLLVLAASGVFDLGHR